MAGTRRNEMNDRQEPMREGRRLELHLRKMRPKRRRVSNSAGVPDKWIPVFQATRVDRRDRSRGLYVRCMSCCDEAKP